MASDNDHDYLAQTDEEFEAALKGLSDDELVAYLQRFHDTMANNREAYPGITDEHLADLKARAEDFEKSVRRADVAEREEAIARTVVEYSADRLLRALPDDDKGN